MFPVHKSKKQYCPFRPQNLFFHSEISEDHQKHSFQEKAMLMSDIFFSNATVLRNLKADQKT